VVSTRRGTFTAEEISKLGIISSPPLVHSRTDYPVPEHLLTDYPIECDIRNIIAKELASRIKWWRARARKFPEVNKKVAMRLEKLCHRLIDVDENHPSYTRCCWAWFKPQLGAAYFLDQLEAQTTKVRAQLYRLNGEPSHVDVYEFFDTLARELGQV
jgi:hypothetical protein